MTNLLANSCVLVVFKVSQWTARKLDKGATQRVLSDNRAASGAGSFHKQLVSKEALGAIASLVSEARTYHYSQTLAWLDDGPRILPAKRHDAYFAQMDAYGEKFDALTAQFVDGYQSYVDDAEDMLGDLFRRADYPSHARIASHFRWECSPMPMPDKADFRADLSATALERVRAEMEQRTNEATALAVRDVFERIHERVAAVVEKLSGYKPADDNGKVSGIFRDSLINNVRDLVDVLPDLNVTGDARIAQLAKDMATLANYDAITLRENTDLRNATANKAADILQAVNDFMA